MQAPSYASARKSIYKFLASLIISFLPNLVLHATKGIAPALSAAAIKASLSLGDIFPLLALYQEQHSFLGSYQVSRGVAAGAPYNKVSKAFIVLLYPQLKVVPMPVVPVHSIY